MPSYAPTKHAQFLRHCCRELVAKTSKGNSAGKRTRTVATHNVVPLSLQGRRSWGLGVLTPDHSPENM